MQLKVQKPLKDLVYLELKHKILTGEIVSQTRLMEIDLSEITYNGDVYLTFDFRDPNNGVAVNAYVVWVIGITFL